MGDWMTTYSGRQFWPLDPRPEEIFIEDIAHALAMICRFAGHTRVFYSVAEHSIHVSRYCRPAQALYGLLHDASEAYLSDIPYPVKIHLPDYKIIEDRLMDCILRRFGIDKPDHNQIKEWDLRILGNERDQVLAPNPVPWWHVGQSIPGLYLQGWMPDQAEQRFLEQFHRLYLNP